MKIRIYIYIYIYFYLDDIHLHACMHAYILHRLLVDFFVCFEVGMNGPALSCRFDDPLRREGRKGETAFKQRQILGG